MCRDVRFNMLQAKTRHAICRKFNIRCAIGDDYRMLGAELNMSNDDIAFISQKENPAEEIFK